MSEAAPRLAAVPKQQQSPPRVRLTDAQRQKLIERTEIGLALLGGEPGEVLPRVICETGKPLRIVVGVEPQ